MNVDTLTPAIGLKENPPLGFCPNAPTVLMASNATNTFLLIVMFIVFRYSKIKVSYFYFIPNSL